MNNVGILYASSPSKLLDCENVAKVSETEYAPAQHLLLPLLPSVGKPARKIVFKAAHL